MPVRSVAVILAVVTSLLCLPARGQARETPSPMVDAINQVRLQHGVPPAGYSRSLSRSSSRFASYLAQTGTFTHASRIIASGRFSKVGEILALSRGRGLRRARTLRNWLSSPVHRSVLLSPRFRYVGAARSSGYFAGRPAVFWTVQFGR